MLPGLTFIIAIAVLVATRILTPAEMIAGFANEQIAIIVMLMLIGEIIRKAGIMDGMFEQTHRSFWRSSQLSYARWIPNKPYGREILYNTVGNCPF